MLEEAGRFIAEQWPALALVTAAALGLIRFGRSVERINANVVGLRRSIVRNARRGARAQLHAARALGRLAARTTRLERTVDELARRAAVAPTPLEGDAELDGELELVARELEAAAAEDEAELVELEAIAAGGAR
ncbi:MAG: hypothetical protein DCC71_02880 [Proteobacteria bacterium]|nr:MAG: hypothetical protein DCC71_02880 [Pseudomonadota bacterium]